MDNFYLIYINKVGKNYKGQYLYEFLFSDSLDDIDGPDWDMYPASGRPEAPHEELIKKVGKLESSLNLDLIQDSDTFAIWDAVDGVIAMAWENINAYESYPDRRLCFKFGEKNIDVENKLYEKDLILNYGRPSAKHQLAS
jgi:hypothetical protein